MGRGADIEEWQFNCHKLFSGCNSDKTRQDKARQSNKAIQ